jgi:competence protein ComEA
MNERRRRLVLWTGVLALTLSLSIPKGHETPPGGAPAVAFLHDKPAGTVTARIAGDLPHPGVYTVTAPCTVADLIRLSAPGQEPGSAGDRLFDRPLADGDVVTVTHGQGENMSLALGSMPAAERTVLGILLDPASMTAADWEGLPGIGPALTERITRYGRERGGIRTLDDLRGVSGIGERTIEKLRPLFRIDRQ